MPDPTAESPDAPSPGTSPSPADSPDPICDETAVPLVELFTDGACSGNPGPGGWAYLLKHPASGHQRERAGGEPRTTNNRMELTAVIEGLKALKQPSRVELYSDSKYVLDGLKSWIHNWKKKAWKNSAKQPVKNAELWKELDALRQQHDLSFHWVQGHAGQPENEHVDTLAVQARDQAAAGRH